MGCIGLFNNREKAIAAWLVVFLTWALFSRDIRSALLNVLKAALHWEIATPFAGMLAYVALVVVLLHRANLWDASLAKDTVYWTLGTAVVLLASAGTGAGVRSFKGALLGSLGLVAVLKFVLDLYTFGLLAEVILVPLLALLGGLSAVAGTSEKYKSAGRLVNAALAAFGTYLLAYAIWRAVGAPDALATLGNLRRFALPPMLTLAFLPFLYLFALLVVYDSTFTRLSIFLKESPGLARFAKWRIVALCHADLWKLDRFAQWSPKEFMKLADRSDVLRMIDGFESRRT